MFSLKTSSGTQVKSSFRSTWGVSKNQRFGASDGGFKRGGAPQNDAQVPQPFGFWRDSEELMPEASQRCASLHDALKLRHFDVRW